LANSGVTIMVVNIRRFLLLSLAMGFLMLPAATAQVSGDRPLPPGLHDLTLPRRDGRAVNYALFIPANYSASKPVPLVLALHFGVGGGPGNGAGSDLLRILVAPALADLGAIIVAPDSLGGNWGTAENKKAVTELLDTVMARYAIDTKKLVVTGYSMGGTGSWQLGEAMPQRFSAAIPIAGTPPASSSGWRIPVLAIHSRDDQVAPFGPTEARISELQKAGVNAKLIALSGITHYETDRFQAALRQAVPWLRAVWK
jgi:predicted peptidase